MDAIIIIIIIYTIFLFADIIPAVKKKQIKAMWFSIPVFLITFIMNIMIQMGAKFTSPNLIIEKVITSILPK